MTKQIKHLFKTFIMGEQNIYSPMYGDYIKFRDTIYFMCIKRGGSVEWLVFGNFAFKQVKTWINSVGRNLIHSTPLIKLKKLSKSVFMEYAK